MGIAETGGFQKGKGPGCRRRLRASGGFPGGETPRKRAKSSGRGNGRYGYHGSLGLLCRYIVSLFSS